MIKNFFGISVTAGNKTNLLQKLYVKCKTGIDFMIFILLFVENYSKCYTIQDFAEWLGTGSNTADINRFRSQ